VGDLSAWMLLILMGNVTTWLVYGIIKADLSLILANAIIMGLTLLMAYMKIRFGSQRKGS